MRYPILIRIDDVCPMMDEQKFNRCIDFLKKYNYKPLLGIIPDCKDTGINYGFISNFWEKVQELKREGYPIAMHGVHHYYTQRQRGLVCRRALSEFAGLPFETQYELLNEGRAIMRTHELDTNIFFAPGHSYDRNTLRALYKAGFSINSDGRSCWAYENENVLNIPASGAFRIHFGRGVLTIALHPSVDSEKTFSDLEVYLNKNQGLLLSWDKIMSIRRRSYTFSSVEEKMNMIGDGLLISAIQLLKRGGRKN